MKKIKGKVRACVVHTSELSAQVSAVSWRASVEPMTTVRVYKRAVHADGESISVWVVVVRDPSPGIETNLEDVRKLYREATDDRVLVLCRLVLGHHVVPSLLEKTGLINDRAAARAEVDRVIWHQFDKSGAGHFRQTIRNAERESKKI